MGEEVHKLEDGKKAEEEAKPAAGDEKKVDPPPPPPPQEVVLRVFMHCEGCAKKVRRCLKGFEGVEDVVTDCKTHKVVVKGEKADPMKILERVQKKSNRKVELLSPVPKPPEEEPKRPEQEEPPKPEEKKDEPPPPVITVVLKVHMHCEACAQEIRKRILKMKEKWRKGKGEMETAAIHSGGHHLRRLSISILYSYQRMEWIMFLKTDSLLRVESAIPDLKSSEVAVKGTFPASELVDYVHKRTGKNVIIVKQDPEPKTEEEKTDKDDEKKDGDGGEKPDTAEKQDELGMLEMRKNEYYYNFNQPANYQLYPLRHAAESTYAYPPAPEMFSDENPNGCNVM